jgi:AhpD family alkylhydroperoxidase
LHLVEIRAFQINGCGQCLDMHTQDARAEGETEQRLYTLAAWRETPFFDERERAALEWTEAVILVAEGHVPDEVCERVKQHFAGHELIDLAIAVTQINSWNRLNVAPHGGGKLSSGHVQGMHGGSSGGAGLRVRRNC